MATLGPIEALGTKWFFEFFEDVDLASVETVVRQELLAFETAYSRFLPNSLVGQLNRDRVVENPPAEFRELLQLAKGFYKETDGVFDILVGERMEAAGYDSNYSFTATLPEAQLDAKILQLTGVLEVAEGDKVVRLKEGKIDLGGFGKGYLIDKLVGIFKQRGHQYFLVNGGGDLFVTSEKGKSVEIKLAHPTETGQVIGSVVLLNQGFAASSPYLRTWIDSTVNQQFNHLLTDNQVSTYVVADKAVTADMWATTLAVAPELSIVSDIEALLLQENKVIQTTPIFNIF